MTARLSIIDRIKVLSRGPISGNDFVALNRPRSHEIDVLPSSIQMLIQMARQKRPLSAMRALNVSETDPLMWLDSRW